jgi:Cu-Zn family superoxide dismutase
MTVTPGAAAALPQEYALPGPAVFPEGITTQPGSQRFYVSSTGDGTIFRGRLDRPNTRVFLPPGVHGRTTAACLRATRTRLVVAGGLTGLIFVYDLRTKRLVRRLSTGTGGLLNDVAITPKGDAYLTDSQRGLVFRVPARLLRKRSGKVRALTPTYRLAQTPVGSFANGIVPAGRRYLLVVGTTTGVLARIDLRTGRVQAVNLGGATLPGGDGMARSGRTLYVVNAASRVTEVRLAANWLSGQVRKHITSPRFRFPTTVAIAGRRLLVVNSQYGARGGTPVLPFSVSAVPR